MKSPRIHPGAYVAPGAIIRGDVEIADRVVILFGVVIRAEFDSIAIGSETNVQDGVVVHCDEGIPAEIGRRVTIGHAAVVHGASIGDHCLVGIGSRALNGAVLGEGAWLAAGAILAEGREIPPWTLAMGIPARPVRELTEAERARQADGVDDYQRIAALYRISDPPSGPAPS
ncbi:MAG: gamma carbonic anhydrase family protein [Acidimicrobiia bacterium]|nr:gamma carbonic anhydrase family protein [Acidimicrobiia bacterium]